MFNNLPIAALINDKILCMHGGLSPKLQDLKLITKISRPTDIPDEGLLCDLLWSDPRDDDREGWDYNGDRGISFVFGEDIIRDFCNKHNLDLICRGHQVIEDGYKFYADRNMVTIFSAPNYCGEFDNKAAVLEIDSELKCKFDVFTRDELIRD